MCRCPPAHEFMDKYVQFQTLDQRTEYAYKTSVKPCCDRCLWCFEQNQLVARVTKPSKAKSIENTQWAFTLTQPPGYIKPGGMSIQESAEKLLRHGLTSKPEQKALKWAYVLEHTEQGTPHVHGVYATQSGKKIGDKYFKRYWPLWDIKKRMGQGHQGGYHAQARHNESYENYLTKEGCVKSSEDILPDIPLANEIIHTPNV